MFSIQPEAIQFTLFGVISLFGVIQGVVISALLLFKEKYDIPIKKYLVMLLLICVVVNAIELIDQLEIFASTIRIWLSPVSFLPLILPAAYFSVKYTLTSETNVTTKEYSLYLPFVFSISRDLYTSMEYVGGNLTAKEILFGSVNHHITLGLELINPIIFLIVFSYLILQIRNHKEEICNQFSAIDAKSLEWISISYIGGLVFAVLWIVLVFLEFKGMLSTNPHHRAFLELGTTMLLYWLFYFALIIHPELFMDSRRDFSLIKKEVEKDSISPLAPIPSKLSDNTEMYHERLLKVMSEKALYRDPDFSLEMLAKEMDLSKGYLSRIINTKEEKNFFDFVNYYRVEEVKRKLMDKSFDHFSIIAIALEAGFKSKSTFNSVFKKMTGTTPSKYKKNHYI